MNDKEISAALWAKRYQSKRPTPAIVQDYAACHDLGAGTIKWYKMIAVRFADFCGGTLTDADFTAEKVNAWLTAMTTEGRLSRVTIKDYRRGIMILWRWGYEERRLEAPPMRVKRIKAPTPVPRGFTIAEMQRLLAAAGMLIHNYPCGVPRALWFVALLRTAWDTGFRPSDLMRLRLTDIGPDGRGAISQHKTGQPVTFQLHESTLAAIAATQPQQREFIFGGVVSRTKFYRAFGKISKAAGLVGATKTIRKGSASAVEAAQPGWGGRFLGHMTPGIFERHYSDPRIVNVNRPVPPSLPLPIDGKEGAA
jgi:integrase